MSIPDKNKITFRPLAVADIPLTHNWLLAPHVYEWYGKKPPTLEEVEKKYLPRVNGKEPTSCFLILYNGTPIGQIQMYKINDYPNYKKIIQINENAAGVDLFIGEKEYQHKGLGSIIMQQFLKNFVFARLAVDSCIIGPNPKNISAIKSYQKAGFKHLKTILNSEDGEEEYLMRYPKENL